MELFKAAESILKKALEAGDPELCIKNHLSLTGNDLIIQDNSPVFKSNSSIKDTPNKTAIGIQKSRVPIEDLSGVSRLRRVPIVGLSGVSEFRFSLSDYDNLIIVGAGKATARMARALEDIFKGTSIPKKGIISVKYGYGESLKYITVIEASHPLPDSNGKRAAQEIVHLLQHAGEKDLVISLISGGGSALLPLPVHGITLEEMQKTTDCLLRSGAEIDEVNAVRKHISQVKGGRLMQIAYPATVCNLLLSDVLGNRIDVIGSGPFVPDESSFSDALDVCKKYNILTLVPEPVKEYLLKGAGGYADETPKKDNHIFKKTYTKIIGSNRQALYSAKQMAGQLGFHSLILSSEIKGEAREFGKVLACIAREIKKTGHPIPPPACILTGGETTVTVKGRGLGGRNQECTLAAVKEIDGMQNICVFCAGTDGTDGPTDAAGAYCTGETYKKGIKKGLDCLEYLGRNDSYHYFEKLKTLIKTGPTKTNLMDIYMVLVGI